MTIGHKVQIAFLKNAVLNDRVPQAMLFSGVTGLGKKRIALEFLNQLGKKDLSYPDLILVAETRGVIAIDQVREVKRSLTLKSDFKAIVVDNAHLMNRDAQNCFLKTLEEPNKNVYFILITSHPRMLKNTIISRCEELKFYQEKDIFNEFKHHPYFQKIIDLSCGKHGVAISFFRNQDLLQEELNKIKQIEDFIKGDLQEKFSFSKKFFSIKENNLSDFLNHLIFYFRTKLITGDFSVKEKIEEIENLKFMLITSNINKRLGFESLILKL